MKNILITDCSSGFGYDAAIYMDAYPHLTPFMEGFMSQVRGAYADPNAPTDPMDVVRCFDTLINMTPGSRPLRSIGTSPACPGRRYGHA